MSSRTPVERAVSPYDMATKKPFLGALRRIP